MLRNSSRAVTTKQALMTDQSSQSPSPRNYTKPITSFLGSPRFKAFTYKGLSEAEPVKSPTSILDTTKPFSAFKNPFSYVTNRATKSPQVFSESKPSWEQIDVDRKGIGVALVDNTVKPIADKNNSCTKPNNRMVLNGTKLRVQIPPLPISRLSPVESPKSPADFGIKTRNSQVSASGSSANSSIQTRESPGLVKVCLTKSQISEMELSEDYTCVISHGPNPKTTHIIDNFIVEEFCSCPDMSKYAPTDFLSCCYTCKKNLEQKNDIYMYRGEKAFCSLDCRYQEMLLDGIED